MIVASSWRGLKGFATYPSSCQPVPHWRAHAKSAASPGLRTVASHCCHCHASSSPLIRTVRSRSRKNFSQWTCRVSGSVTESVVRIAKRKSCPMGQQVPTKFSPVTRALRMYPGPWLTLRSPVCRSPMMKEPQSAAWQQIDPCIAGTSSNWSRSRLSAAEPGAVRWKSDAPRQ